MSDLRKLKKRKAREEKNKQDRLQRERTAADKRQAEAAAKRQEEQLRKDMRQAQRQQDKLDKWAEGFMENMDKLPPETRAKILHNIQILKALEQEYEKEQLAKKATNDQLEAEGHTSLQDKLDALHSDLAEQQKALAEQEAESNQEEADPSCIGSVGGSADCSFKVN